MIGNVTDYWNAANFDGANFELAFQFSQVN